MEQALYIVLGYLITNNTLLFHGYTLDSNNKKYCLFFA